MAILDAPTTTMNDPKTIRGWAMFDWANSAFALVITVAIFPGYFSAVTDDMVNILGYEISNSNLYSWAITGAYILIALFSPWLSGIADFGGKKMFFMKFFTSLGAIGCLSLLFFKDMSSLWIGTVGFIVAMIGFAGGLVFYNSYLPEIASEDQYDRVSAKGFSYGYVGSVLLLIVNLAMILQPDLFGLPDKEYLPTRITFVMVGLWWIGFAQIPFRELPPDAKGKAEFRELGKRGWEEIKKVWKAVKTQAQIKRFLLSFFFYSMGVQTVLYLASIFAEKELGFPIEDLIVLILILQVVAIFGAQLFARITDFEGTLKKQIQMIGIWIGICGVVYFLLPLIMTLPKWALPVVGVVAISHIVITGSGWIFSKTIGMPGNKFSITASLLIWVAVCLLAYFVKTDTQFFIIAAGVGLVMGGIQSLSRSTYSKLMPEKTEDTASYFSFYDVLEKVAIASGTLMFGLAELLTGNIRNSVLLLGCFFVIGIIILIPLKVKRAEEPAT